MSGRGNWKRNPNNWGMWNPGMRGPPPGMFRGRGYGPRGPGFFPGPPMPRPPLWGGIVPRGRGGPRSGFGPRGGIGKPFPGKFGGRGGKSWNSGRTKNSPGKRLSEEEIGVTEYVSDHEGFNGIIKSRYSDFQVNEIDLEGNIAKLTDKKIPEPPKDLSIEEDDSGKYNLDILPLETWEKINELVINKTPPSDRVEIDVTGKSKEDRTKIHDAVKKQFGDAIVGSTVTTDEKKLVRLEKYRKGVRIDKRVKWLWPGEYIYFIVHKENCDTMDAAGRISERLNMPVIRPSMMGYAGTKDRRAKSSQWFSMRKMQPRKIAHACKDLREIHVGNYKFGDKPLKLGMLRGNRFRIALRNVTAGEEVISNACESLKEKGFINFYGLQRFGTRFDTPTYVIGLKLLKGDFKGAINDILEPRSGPLEQSLKKYAETGNATQAVHFLRRHSLKSVEGRLLRALSRDPNDLLGALNRLVRNTRLLYIHSYQSLVWNRCVSERIKLFGLQPAVGDLVLADTESPLEETQGAIDIDPQDSDEEEETDENGTESKTETVTESSAESNEETKMDVSGTEQSNGDKKTRDEKKAKIPVKILTQEDIDSGRYTISDIILPLPGYNIEYPPNIKHFYEEILTKDNLTLELRNKIKSFSMSGAYRHMIIKPTDLEWSLVKYTDPLGDLIQSDFDEMSNKPITAIIEDGKYNALLLSLSLPASCYATMALRELLKRDTASDTQAEQNNYHNGETETKAESTEAEATKEVTAESGVVSGEAGEKRKLETAEENVEAKKAKTEE